MTIVTMDIEGHEVEVLEGFLESFKKEGTSGFNVERKLMKCLKWTVEFLLFFERGVYPRFCSEV